MAKNYPDLASMQAYIDPNTYGPLGYAHIGPLLLFFEKVVVYAPSSNYISQCFRSSEYSRTALRPDEFAACVEKGWIVPLGFETFFDPAIRAERYVPGMAAIDEFDIDLMNPSTALGRRVVRVSNDFKHDQSPLMAKSWVGQAGHQQRCLMSALEDVVSLPSRYDDFVKGRVPIPVGLEAHLPGLDRSALLPYLVLYDFLNNKHVMGVEGHTNLHVEYTDYADLYGAIHGLVAPVFATQQGSDPRALARAEIVGLITDGIRLSCRHVEFGRLTLEEISEFRMTVRASFVSSIFTFLRNVGHLDAPEARREAFLERLERHLEVVQRHVRIDVESVLQSLLSQLGLAFVSNVLADCFYGPQSSRRGRIHHALQRPIWKHERWAYQLVRGRK